jgi:hypothetical protein
MKPLAPLAAALGSELRVDEAPGGELRVDEAPGGELRVDEAAGPTGSGTWERAACR